MFLSFFFFFFQIRRTHNYLSLFSHYLLIPSPYGVIRWCSYFKVQCLSKISCYQSCRKYRIKVTLISGTRIVFRFSYCSTVLSLGETLEDISLRQWPIESLFFSLILENWQLLVFCEDMTKSLDKIMLEVDFFPSSQSLQSISMKWLLMLRYSMLKWKKTIIPGDFFRLRSI